MNVNNFFVDFLSFLCTLYYLYIERQYMGRKKKYLTIEDKRIARNELRMKYYNQNSECEKKKALERYYKNKEQKSI